MAKLRNHQLSPTWTRASLSSSLIANSSRVNTSGYWVLSKACSNWCSWNVVKVVRDRLILREFETPLPPPPPPPAFSNSSPEVEPAIGYIKNNVTSVSGDHSPFVFKICQTFCLSSNPPINKTKELYHVKLLLISTIESVPSFLLIQPPYLRG